MEDKREELYGFGGEQKVETALIEISEKMMRNGWSIKEKKPDKAHKENE